MLKQRVITAILLLLVLVPAALWLPAPGWALFTAGVIALGAWEWGALAGLSAGGRKIYAALLFALMAVAVGLAQAYQPALMTWGVAEAQLGLLIFYGLASLFWVALVPLWLRQRWSPRGGAGALLGLVVLLPAWLAVVQLRALGLGVLLAVLALAWVADIAAYFSGRAFGKHKLAPSVSPGKTWEGVAGAIVGVLLFGFWLGPWPAGVALSLWAFILVLLTGVSVVGDLFESLLKRLAGIKDSSQLLPGHGGILDRIDSLTAILPVSAFILLFLT